MYDFSNLTQSICCTCLIMGENFQILSPEVVHLYKMCVNELNSDVKFKVCVCNICAYMLKKFNKFMKQCQKAYNILNGVAEDNKFEFYETGLKLACDLTKETIFSLNVTEYCNIFNEQSADISDDNYMDDDDDLPLVKLKNEEVKEEQNEEIQSNKSIKEKENSNLETKHIITDSGNLRNGEMIKERIQVKSKKRSKQVKREGKKRKKEIKDGFTSRMVQETDEYTVIKLSKEQVLKEMEEKSKSEEYLRSLYKCEKCVKGFNFEDVLTSHMERHVKKKNWLLCDLCQQYCPSMVSLRGHMKSHTTRYKCKVCSCVRLSRQVLLEHHSSSHTFDGQKYTCQLCDFVSNKRTSMQRHVKTRHNKPEKHPCEQCGKTLNSLEALRVHTARHDKTKRVKCEECDKWFVYPSLLHQHKMAVHVRDDYYCVECDVKFKSRENLSLHFKKNKKHRDISTFRYSCEHCSKRFMFLSALSTHTAAVHGNGGLALMCTHCCHSFTRKSLLRAHMQKHANENPFVCECGATFSQQDMLAAHTIEKHKKTEADIQIRGSIAQDDV